MFLIFIIIFSIAVLVVSVMYPFVLVLARKHKVLDNPNERKLHRNPMPVMGGVAVWFGIAAACALECILPDIQYPFICLVCMTLMMLVGLWDDVCNITPALRILLETLVLWLLMMWGGRYANDFHGLMGIGYFNMGFSVPLSIVGGIGIINSINLIDGVDGYCSGYCIMASLLFSVLFFRAGDVAMGAFAIACAGALIPFFLHNVFGRDTKMFIGDCGSLMMGMAMTYFVFYAIAHNGSCSKLSAEGVDLISYALAVLSVPVIDTLRVMTVRIARRRSPFSPDKTHLHHLFIDAGFSHVGAAMACILMGLTVFCIWLLSYLAGASANLQFVVTVLSGGTLVIIFYALMRIAQRNDSVYWKTLCRIGTFTHREGSRWWAFVTRRVDK